MAKLSFPWPWTQAPASSRCGATSLKNLSTTAITAVIVIGISLNSSTPVFSNSKPAATFASKAARSSKRIHAQSRQDVRDLKSGESIERELTRNNPHSYRADLNAGDYIRVVIDQKGIDVSLTVSGPDGKKIVQLDNATANNKEIVYLIGETSGEYDLRVDRQDTDAVNGRYEIRIEEWRPATQKDRDRFAAQMLHAEGYELGGQGLGKAEGLKKGIEKFERALALWRSVEDPVEEAFILGQIGFFYTTLNEPEQSLKYHTMALPLHRAAKDRYGEAITLNNIGTVYLSIGDLQKALEYYEQALTLKQLIGDRKSEANTLYHIATVYSRSGDLQKSQEFYEKALPLTRATGERRGEAMTLNAIGSSYYTMGEWEKCSEYSRQALAIFRELGDKRNESLALNTLGTVYSQLGDVQTAIEYFGQALSLRREFGDKRGQAFTLSSLGLAYSNLGDNQKALDHFDQSLPLMRAIGDKYGEAYLQSYIGLVYLRSGDSDKAKDYFNQALRLSMEVGDRAGEALARRNLGSTYLNLNESEKAAEYFSAALEISKAMGDRAREAVTLNELARIDLRHKRLNEAISKIETSLGIVESIRRTITSQELRAAYLATKRNLYELYIEALMQSHKENPEKGIDALALQVSERARARSLLDVLTGGRADIRQGVDLELIDRERQVERQLSMKSERLTRLLAGKHTEDQERAAKKEVDALLADYRDVQAQLRSKSPGYAALTQPQPLSVSEIQKEVLDDDTLLLEYALGEEHSYLWAVTTTSINAVELPGRAQIAGAAQRVYQLLVTKSDEAYPEALSKLSEMILKPVAKQLGKKRLIIVTEGDLQYIPFGALPNPVRLQKASSHESSPLILSHEIVNAPSATTLALIRRGKSHRRPAQKTLAVLADPVFARDDERVKPTTKGLGNGLQNVKYETKKTRRESDVERSSRDLDLNSFERLSLTRREAELITSLASPGQPLKALDFAASRNTATSSSLEEYRIVHFATHSLLNNQHPELSGIVLSLVDEAGDEQDGFLRLYEIYNLKLNADLVVLSACQTALGKEIKAEGLVGLTRGFMYAGVPRVVASLWKVSDKGTSELMKRFYQRMLKDGMSPSGALRAAQISMLREKPWHSAYYWAGFVLQGEWKISDK